MILVGDAREHLEGLPPASVDLSFWSPPYFVGKTYEQHLTFDCWQTLLSEVIAAHSRILRPGGFMAVNIADILCFPDAEMPRYQADNIGNKASPVTRADVLDAMAAHPGASRHELAAVLGCSEQTVQRRLEGNNVRGGKHQTPTRIQLTGSLIVGWAADAGLYLYDQRIWHKDPCWANSRWHSNSYRAVDEFEHVFVFWQPGVTTYDRDRLDGHEWAEWGSRGVWEIRSVRRNDRHEAEFPEELARRVIRLFSPRGGGRPRSVRRLRHHYRRGGRTRPRTHRHRTRRRQCRHRGSPHRRRSTVQPERIEQLERTALAMVAQALRDYRQQAATIFDEETDQPQDIAEDIVREAIAAMGLSEMHLRLYGKVDVKKAIYVFAPDAEPVALMLDAKAEKDSNSTATIQMSQTSMTVHQHRGNEVLAVDGGLSPFIDRDGRRLLVVTVVAKFFYDDLNGGRSLSEIIVACIPNGSLQDAYNPHADDTIWRAGRNAPSRGEDFRVRLHYGALSEKAPWRVCRITPDKETP